MNAQRLSAAVSLWALRNLIFAACLLIGSSCDKFIVPICELDPGNEVCVNTSAADGGLPDLTKRTPDSPLGLLRRFDWRAKIDNTDNRKFVGIDKKEYAISLVNDTSVHFSAARFDLENADLGRRLDPVACVGCPSTNEINFSVDRVFLTGEVERDFWLLRDGTFNRSFVFDRNGKLSLRDGNLDDNMNRKPFFHPILNACLIPLKTLIGPLSAIVRMNIGASQAKTEISATNPITVSMIGDIDSIDPVKNGIEIVNFSGGFVASVRHFDPMSMIGFEDSVLASALHRVIQGRKINDADVVEAAYVSDLNRDGFQDFIFSVGGKIFSSSYRGKDSGSGQPVFQSWTDPIQEMRDEKVRSIMALDLTKDGFPELIVETDKAVHFYLNTLNTP